MNGKLKAILLLGVMYGLGVVSGIAWQKYQYFHWPMRPGMFAEHRVKRLKSQLKLSPDQEKAIEVIFQNAHERASEVNEEVSWDLADIHRDSVQAIRKLLTPDQLIIFEKIHRQYHARHKHIPDDDLEESTVTTHAEPS